MLSKEEATHYLRQSSAAQVEHNRESTARQYALAARARELGWPEERVIVIDEDLGLSGSGVVARSGFARLTAEVALARVGLVLGLEVSRLARNNADWHRLILGPIERGHRGRRRCRRRRLLAVADRDTARAWDRSRAATRSSLRAGRRVAGRLSAA